MLIPLEFHLRMLKLPLITGYHLVKLYNFYATFTNILKGSPLFWLIANVTIHVPDNQLFMN
jgi:hypothetical protein